MGTISYRRKTAASEIQFFRNPDIATADFDGTDTSSLTAAQLSPEGYNYFAEGFYLWVGTSGDVKVITYEDWAKNGKVINDSYAQILPGLAAGIWHPVRVVKILQSGTTVTDIRVGV
jgi:hypothetical protein